MYNIKYLMGAGVFTTFIIIMILVLYLGVIHGMYNNVIRSYAM